nr:DUF945 family protein [Escherichia coli]
MSNSSDSDQTVQAVRLPEKAQKRADKQISGMMTLGQMFQLITIDNNTASLQLRYTPGKVVFNGQEMSEEEFMSRAGRFVH